MSRLSLAAAVRMPVAPVASLARVLRVLKTANAVTRQRRHLAQLDDTRLRDIGLTRTEALIESQRPFWDAPSYWR